METIESDQTIPVDVPFRVQAGPGAGKTYWLVKQIAHTIRKSKRLRSPAKIACISYTNVAGEKLTADIAIELGCPPEAVEVGTIHSFLYRNIVRPYLHLLSGDVEIDHAAVKGHDEHRPTHGRVERWLKNNAPGSLRQGLYQNKPDYYAYLKQTAWQFDDDLDTLQLRPRQPYPRPPYFPSRSLDSYKPFYWRNGIIDHEDVLYFAYRLFTEHPELRRFVAARFPYIYLDEFQDTHPIQTRIMEAVAEAGSTIGVIGDPEQSIYGFMGAEPQDFNQFSVSGLQDYRIVGNRRSTNEIVSFLNDIRADKLVQQPVRDESGPPVTVLVGPDEKVVEVFRADLPAEGDYAILARRNDRTRALRSAKSSSGLLTKIEDADRKRSTLLTGLAKAILQIRQTRHGRAVKEILSTVLVLRRGQLRGPWSGGKKIPAKEMECRSCALSVATLLSDIDDEDSILDVYLRLKDCLEEENPAFKLKGVRKGTFQQVTRETTIGELLATVSVGEDNRTVRTIHQAKGEDYETVLVFLSEVTHLFPGDQAGEERRISYVAFSRAKDGLFIGVKELSSEKENELRELGVKTIRCE